MLPIILIVTGVVLGVYLIADKTGFLSMAWESLPGPSNSGIIKIPLGPAKSPVATGSATPTASASAKVSPKPSESSKSANASTSAQASSGAKLKFPVQPDAKIEISPSPSAKEVKGIITSPSLIEQMLRFIFK